MISYGKIDEVIDRLIEERKQFTLQEVTEHLAQATLPAEEHELLEQRVARNLSGREEVFADNTQGNYHSREHWFKDGHFLHLPDHYELENGILIPGHLFAPFCSPDIFPSEVELLWQDELLPVVDWMVPVELAVNHHLLLGSEEMFDVFVAENSRNQAVMLNNRNGDIALTVFDIRRFLSDTDFQPGDMIMFTIKSWGEGRFSIAKLAEAERPGDKNRWIEKLSQAVLAADEHDADYMEIPEQLSRAIFRGGRELLQLPGATLDEFIRESTTVQMTYANGATILGPVENATEETDNFSPPPEVRLSQGNTDDLNSILKECGAAVTQQEIEAFMLDQCHQRQLEFEQLLQRCFAPDSLHFADEGQEAVFINLLEDLWEQITARYNRELDSSKAPVRERALELVEQRLGWLEELRRQHITPGEKGEKIMHQVAEIAVRLEGVLRLLSLDSRELTADTAENLLDAIEQVEEQQQRYFDEFEIALSED